MSWAKFLSYILVRVGMGTERVRHTISEQVGVNSEAAFELKSEWSVQPSKHLEPSSPGQWRQLAQRPSGKGAEGHGRARRPAARRIVGEAREGRILQGLWTGSGLWPFSEYGGSYWRIFSSSLIAADRC